MSSVDFLPLSTVLSCHSPVIKTGLLIFLLVLAGCSGDDSGNLRVYSKVYMYEGSSVSADSSLLVVTGYPIWLLRVDPPQNAGWGILTFSHDHPGGTINKHSTMEWHKTPPTNLILNLTDPLNQYQFHLEQVGKDENGVYVMVSVTSQ